MRFCGHVPNSPGNRNLKRLILNLLEKVVFLDPKRLLSPFCRDKKTETISLLKIGNKVVEDTIKQRMRRGSKLGTST
jgi:hypothetical protein